LSKYYESLGIPFEKARGSTKKKSEPVCWGMQWPIGLWVINLTETLNLPPRKRRLIEIKSLKEAWHFQFMEIKMFCEQ